MFPPGVAAHYTTGQSNTGNNNTTRIALLLAVVIGQWTTQQDKRNRASTHTTPTPSLATRFNNY
jgi:hypothetical protein